ncbi:MAG: hypothetical protein QM831_33765 [Kofleriaceae bacterium]
MNKMLLALATVVATGCGEVVYTGPAWVDAGVTDAGSGAGSGSAKAAPDPSSQPDVQEVEQSAR